MTRAKDISKIVTDANLSGTLDVTGDLTVVGSSTFDDIKLTAVALPAAGNPSIALRDTNNIVYHQSGSGNSIVLLDSSQNTMYNASSTSHIFNISNSEKMRIDSSGTVYINGTTSAVSNGGLNVETTSAGTTTTALALHNQSGGNDSGVQISHRGKRNTGAQHDYSYIQSVADDVTAGNGSLRFWTSGSASLAERMRIDSSGNVGIGGTPLAYPLEIYGANGDGLLFKETTNSVTNWFGGFNSAGTVGTLTNHPLSLVVNGTERMRIDSSGNVLVGTTTVVAKFNAVGSNFGISSETTAGTNGGTAYSSKRSSDGIQMRFYQGSTVCGDISTNGSAVNYGSNSDYRLKENVVTDWDATTRLKQLNPVRFNFIANADTTVDGFLAHEVQSVVPEAISGTHNEVDADGNPVYQGIDQSKLVPLLVKTIQELEARITALENGE